MPSWNQPQARGGPVRVRRGPPPPPHSRLHPPPPHVRMPMASGPMLVRRPPPRQQQQQRVLVQDSSGTIQFMEAAVMPKVMRVRPAPPQSFQTQQRMQGQQPYPSQRHPSQPPRAPAPHHSRPQKHQLQSRQFPQQQRSMQTQPAFSSSSPSSSSSARQRLVATKSTAGRIQTPYQRKLQEKKQQHQPSDSYPRRAPRAFVSPPAEDPVFEDDCVVEDEPDTEAEVSVHDLARL